MYRITEDERGSGRSQYRDPDEDLYGGLLPPAVLEEARRLGVDPMELVMSGGSSSSSYSTPYATDKRDALMDKWDMDKLQSLDEIIFNVYMNLAVPKSDYTERLKAIQDEYENRPWYEQTADYFDDTFNLMEEVLGPLIKDIPLIGLLPGALMESLGSFGQSVVDLRNQSFTDVSDLASFFNRLVNIGEKGMAVYADMLMASNPAAYGIMAAIEAAGEGYAELGEGGMILYKAFQAAKSKNWSQAATLAIEGGKQVAEGAQDVASDAQGIAAQIERMQAKWAELMAWKPKSQREMEARIEALNEENRKISEFWDLHWDDMMGIYDRSANAAKERIKLDADGNLIAIDYTKRDGEWFVNPYELMYIKAWLQNYQRDPTREAEDWNRAVDEIERINAEYEASRAAEAKALADAATSSSSVIEADVAAAEEAGEPLPMDPETTFVPQTGWDIFNRDNSEHGGSSYRPPAYEPAVPAPTIPLPTPSSAPAPAVPSSYRPTFAGGGDKFGAMTRTEGTFHSGNFSFRQ